MPDLGVRSIHARAVREPVSGRSYTLIRVETRSGLSGWGECRAADAAATAQAQQMLAGIQATAWEVAQQRLAGLPALAGAVNMALLDIVGQAAKAPVYEVLGGPTRHKARALARLAGRTDAELAAALGRARAAGFRAAAVPVARGVRATRQRLEALHAAAPEVDLVLEGGAALTPGEASSIAAALEHFHLLWFDEPCPVSNLVTLRKISSETVTPVGLGRGFERAGLFQDALREQVVDIVRPDLARFGLSGVRRIAALAETYYTAVAPYAEGGPVATAAALNLAASLPNFFIQQIPLPEAEEDRRFRRELAGFAETVVDGFAQLPQGPGLGLNVKGAAA